MTFNEVLNRILFNIYGNTLPAANVQNVLIGANGIISRSHHRIQIEHNFWFMRTWAEVTTEIIDEEFVQSYVVPDNIKEILTVQWHIEDDEGNMEGFTKPLARLTDEQAQYHFWPGDNIDAVEYPEYFEVVNNMITFYPDGNVARTAVINYWEYIECLFDDEEDALMREGPEVVIALATSQIYLHLHEVDLANYWRSIYQDELELLIKKDYSKRRSHINEFGTQESFT